MTHWWTGPLGLQVGLSLIDETLLTLLETFVNDPLLDWTPGLAGGCVPNR